MNKRNKENFETQCLVSHIVKNELERAEKASLQVKVPEDGDYIFSHYIINTFSTRKSSPFISEIFQKLETYIEENVSFISLSAIYSSSKYHFPDDRATFKSSILFLDLSSETYRLAGEDIKKINLQKVLEIVVKHNTKRPYDPSVEKPYYISVKEDFTIATDIFMSDELISITFEAFAQDVELQKIFGFITDISSVDHPAYYRTEGTALTKEAVLIYNLVKTFANNYDEKINYLIGNGILTILFTSEELEQKVRKHLSSKKQ